MVKNKETFTITAALPYANGPIHIGHLAGVYIPADIYARYKRLTDNEVAFICGSDEHGVAISLASKKASISQQEHPLQLGKCTIDSPRPSKGAIIRPLFAFCATVLFNLGKIMLCGHENVGKRFIIAQQHIIARF